MNYVDILLALKRIAKGNVPADYERKLRILASNLKHNYNIEPVDIIAAIHLFNAGRVNYGMYLLRRAFKDLIRIGKQQGLLTEEDIYKLRSR